MDSAYVPPRCRLAHYSVAVDRKSRAERQHLAPYLVLDLGISLRAVPGDAVEHVGDQMTDLAELTDPEPARRAGRRTQPHARRHGELFRIARDAVLVDGDP